MLRKPPTKKPSRQELLGEGKEFLAEEQAEFERQDVEIASILTEKYLQDLYKESPPEDPAE